jgi:hypothetical protein
MVGMDTQYKSLIICTLSKQDLKVQGFVEEMKGYKKDIEVIFTEEYKINHCIGCTRCWMKTPGRCVIKDDYEKIFRAFLAADHVILLTEATRGFISYKMKNIVDRLLPLAVPYTCIKDGAARHISRYGKSWNIGLVYTGEPHNEFLDEWMERFVLNFHSKSLGAFCIEEREVLYGGLSNI